MTTLNIEEIKTKIEDLHTQGLTADDIIHQLSLPFDIDNTVSAVNQRFLLSRAEEGATEEELTSIAELIALLRSYKQDEVLSSQLSEDDYNHYQTLRDKYRAESSKPAPDYNLLSTLTSEAKNTKKLI